MTEIDYEFSEDWFSHGIPYLEQLFREHLPQPTKLLEIGSFEGRSAVWLVNKFGGGDISLYCIDTWEGGFEHVQRSLDMQPVEQRFDSNIAKCRLKFPKADIQKIKNVSNLALAALLSEGHQSSFDFIFVDGSHQTPDVLSDLTLAFALCRMDGIIVCDDYLWGQERFHPLLTPKLGIDSFLKCYQKKVAVIDGFPRYQMYLQKIAE